MLNSNIAIYLLNIINPTMNYGAGTVGAVPFVVPDQSGAVTDTVARLIVLSREDWNTYETSWDFAVNPLVALCDSLRPLRSLCQHPCSHFASQSSLRSGDIPQGEEVRSAECGVRSETNSDSSEATLTLRQDQETRNVSGASEKSEFQIEKLYASLREEWARDCEEMRRLEIENNRIFIEAYGLQDELTPDVPWHEITLTCNPYYRYGARASDKSESPNFPREAVLEERLKSDTVKELVSYGIGCLMGRYSLEKEGLILASQGETLEDKFERGQNLPRRPISNVRGSAAKHS